jgi:predicted nucleic acid-binding protein
MATLQIPRLLWDTTVYINYFSKGILPSHLARGHLFLSSVVMQELYAAAESKKSLRKLDLLFETMSYHHRIVTPSSADWRQAGVILAGIGRKYGYEIIGRSRLTNDVLIAICAMRADSTLCTSNSKDFNRIRQFLDFSFVII